MREAHVTIRFSSQQEAVEWVDEGRRLGYLPEKAALRRKDALDERRRARPNRISEFVIASIGEPSIDGLVGGERRIPAGRGG